MVDAGRMPVVHGQAGAAAAAADPIPSPADPTDLLHRTTILLPRSPRYPRLVPDQLRGSKYSRQAPWRAEWFDSISRSGVSLELALPGFQHPRLRRHFPIHYYFGVADGAGGGAAVVGADTDAGGAGVAFFATCCDLSQEVVVAFVSGRERLSPMHRHVPSLRCYFRDLWTPNRLNPLGHRYRRHHHTYVPKSPLECHRPRGYLDGDSIQDPAALSTGTREKDVLTEFTETIILFLNRIYRHHLGLMSKRWWWCRWRRWRWWRWWWWCE